MITRPFTYNPSPNPLIAGTEQLGDLAIGTPTSGFTNSPTFWNGPDEEQGYVICYPVPAGDHPTSISGVTAFIGFNGTKNMVNPFSESTFVELVNYRFNQNFTNGNDASTWCTNNGYWNSYSGVSITPTPTQTNAITPTSSAALTLTPTPTLTETPTSTPSGTPLVTETPTETPTTTPSGTPLVTETPTETPTSTPSGTPDVTPTPTTSIGETPTNTPTLTETPTETPTPTVTETPTSTPSGTPSVTETPTETPTPTVTETPTETPTPAVTETPTETPTNTPTPSVTPQAVTGYSFNLVQLPYNFPTSGNSIINQGAVQSGDTNPNILTTSGRGFYFNSIDTNGTDRTDYYSGFTGQSVTITLTQTGSTAIYSGDSQSFKVWSVSGLTGFVFGTGVGVPPTNTPSGNAVLIQSANTEWNFGIPVYVSLTINGLVTPTPTVTETPTGTPAVTETPTETPTPTVTETPTGTPAVTETPTETPTPTVTETPTETPTPTVTETPTGTPAVTETPTETPTPTVTETPTETPTNTPTETETPTPTPSPVAKFYVYNNSTNRTISNINGNGPWSLSVGSYPISPLETAYGISHPALTFAGLDQLVVQFGGTGAIDISMTKNGSPYTPSSNIPTTNVTASQINYFINNPSDLIQTNDVIVFTITDSI